MSRPKKKEQNIVILQKTYISNRTIHLGSLKRTIPKCTIINYKKQNDIQSISISGQSTTNIQDFQICLKHGFISQYNNDVKEIKEIENKKEQKTLEKMPIYKSDEDQISLVSKLEQTNETKNQQKKEQKYQQIRGLKVIKQDNPDIQTSDGIKIKISTEKTSNSQEDISKQINGQGKIVGKVSQISTKKQKSAKSNAQKMAKVRAAKRKKQSEQNQKKMKQAKKK